MRGMRRVADQDDILVVPSLSVDAREPNPGMGAQMRRRVLEQGMSLEPRAEHHLAGGDARGHVAAVEAGGTPGALVAFHDERGVCVVKAVGVRLVNATVGFREQECEGVEEPRRAEPDVPRGADVDVRLKGRRVLLSDDAVHSVRGHDSIDIMEAQGREVPVVAYIGVKSQLDAKRLRTPLQDVEQRAPRDPAEAVSTGRDDRSLDVDVDVVPAGEVSRDLSVTLLVRDPQVVERLLRKHDAPPVCVGGAIALQHRDMVRGALLLQEQREVQPGGPATDGDDVHADDFTLLACGQEARYAERLTIRLRQETAMRFIHVATFALASVAASCATTSSMGRSSGTLDAVARAMGGKDRILAVRTFILEGRGDQLNFGQNNTPMAETRFDVTSYRLAMDLPNRRHLIDVTRVPRFTTGNMAPQRIRLGLDRDVGYGILPNGNMTRAGAQAAADRAHNPIFHPIGFVQMAYATGTMVTEESAGANTQIVRIDAGGRRYAMTVDTRTNLPTRIETMVDQPMLGDVRLVMDLSDYQQVSGLQVPTRMVQRYDNLFTLSDVRISNARINEDVGNLAATDSIRTVMLPATPPAPTIVVDTLAPGVWSIAGQTHHTIAIEQANGIVLIEAPQTDARTLAAIAKARELRPGKPITAMVNTHHHFDHSGGLRAAISQDLTIITQAGNKEFYERIVFPRQHTIVRDALAQNPKPLRLTTVADKHVLPDPQRPVELYHVNSPHSGSMLVAYLPAERMLIQADLYNPPPPNPATPPVFPFVKSLVDDVQRRGLQVDRVVGIHGRPVPFSELQAAASRSP
jgi:glyoxylase-like metal-dependent hydrolase (beta-lactamase superfamily II)